MALNFADVASKKLEDIEAPPLAPVGTYRWRVAKLPTTRKSGDEKWEFLTFWSKVVEPLDNVDPTDYPGDITNIMLGKQFIFNCEDDAEFEKKLFEVRTFLEKHIKCTEPGMTMAQMLNAAQNGEYLGDVAWEPDKRDESGETFQAVIKKTAPVE
jgi:hypothetical protein